MNIDTIKRAKEVWGNNLIVITDNQYVAFTGHGRYMIMDDAHHCVYSFRANSDNAKAKPLKGKIFDYDEIQFIDRELTYDEMIQKFDKLLSDGVITQAHYDALLADAVVSFKGIASPQYTEDESIDESRKDYIGSLNGFSQSIPDVNKIFKDRNIDRNNNY